MGSRRALLFAWVGILGTALAEPCNLIKMRDICIVSAEDAQTCHWCSGPAGEGCYSQKGLPGAPFECDNGNEEVVTRFLGVKPPQSALGPESDDYIPVVFMHGLGDAGHNAGMQSLAKSVMTAYPGSYSVSVDVADGFDSYKDIGPQVEAFAQAVKSDANLARGFTAVGLSQGGLIVRVYTELYNDPPVRTLMSLCGVQEGVGDCPGGTPKIFCSLVRESLYEAPVSFAGYWKNAKDKATYLEKSKYLANWNNERDSTRNSTYTDNMKSVDKYILVQALNDTVVHPHESENHQFFAWGTDSEADVVPFTETDGYKGDWLGLQTLDSQKKIDHYSFEGNHLRWSQEFWETVVLPYFNTTFSAVEKRAPLRGLIPDQALLVSQAH